MPKLSPLTARGTKRKLAPYVHWTRRRGATAKLRRAIAKRKRGR